MNSNRKLPIMRAILPKMFCIFKWLLDERQVNSACHKSYFDLFFYTEDPIYST